MEEKVLGGGYRNHPVSVSKCLLA